MKIVDAKITPLPDKHYSTDVHVTVDVNGEHQ